MSIVIKGAGDGEVIFDGNGNFNLFNVKAADYNYFEGVTIRNTDIAIWAGAQFIAGSKGLTVRKYRLENVAFGVLLGRRDDSKHLLDWVGAFWAQFAEVDGQKFPPTPARPTPRSACMDRGTWWPIITWPTSTMESTWRPTAIRTARTRLTAPAARELGPPAGFHRLLQQLHDQFPRQRLRDRWQHAQRSGHAKHYDQLGFSPVLQPACDRVGAATLRASLAR